jgi:hypothetical protein
LKKELLTSQERNGVYMTQGKNEQIIREVESQRKDLAENEEQLREMEESSQQLRGLFEEQQTVLRLYGNLTILLSTASFYFKRKNQINFLLLGDFAGH